MIIAFIIIFGLVIGSFLSVCIYRIPRADAFYIEENTGQKPEASPIGFNDPVRSICPHCEKQLYWWHNIPVVSWILLRGRCGFCKTRISVRYPATELITALAATATYLQFGLTPTAALIFIFTCSLIVITVIDYDYYIIPDVISIPGFFIAVALAGVNHFFHFFKHPIVPNLWESFWGILAGGGFLWAIAEGYFRLRKQEGLGLGDVKLLAFTGALFGLECSIFTIFVGSLLGSIIGVALVVFSKRSFKAHLPFGPYLALATILYIYFGDTETSQPFHILGNFIRSLSIFS